MIPHGRGSRSPTVFGLFGKRFEKWPIVTPSLTDDSGTHRTPGRASEAHAWRFSPPDETRKTETIMERIGSEQRVVSLSPLAHKPSSDWSVRVCSLSLSGRFAITSTSRSRTVLPILSASIHPRGPRWHAGNCGENSPHSLANIVVKCYDFIFSAILVPHPGHWRRGWVMSPCEDIPSASRTCTHAARTLVLLSFSLSLVGRMGTAPLPRLIAGS